MRLLLTTTLIVTLSTSAFASDQAGFVSDATVYNPKQMSETDLWFACADEPHEPLRLSMCKWLSKLHYNGRKLTVTKEYNEEYGVYVYFVNFE